jgi:hypothetical protein
VATEQDYCDWCYGPVSDDDRRRAHDLGIDAESSWACQKCLDSGRVGHPPDEWEGDPKTWPVRVGWQGISREQCKQEARQLSRMRKRLWEFQAGEVYIATLISDLEGLLTSLELASEEWIDTFRELWSDLEIPYAVALDRREPIPDNSDPTVKGGVDALLALVEDRLWVVS